MAAVAVTGVLAVGGAAQSCDPPTGSAGTAGDGQLAALQVRPADTGAHYDRDEWGDWSTVGGCDTRERVLKRDGRDVVSGAGCRILSGTWTSPYDGATVTAASALDIDHVVPVKEANQSGARDWSAGRKAEFYNDLANLLAVDAHDNRAKGDQDPARWLPSGGYRCTYVRGYVDVKVKYQLSVDLAEHDAIAAVLSKC